MAPETILITGAGGFVGRHLCPALAAAFPATRIVAAGHGAAFPLDVTDRAAVTAAVAALRPDVCLHLAAITSIAGARTDTPAAWRVNLHGSLNLADAILEEAPSCRLLFVSSAEIYGRSFAAGAALDETAPLAPMNAYAATKAAADLALGALAEDGLRLVRLRPFNHAGPGQSEAFALASFAGQIARIEAGQAPPEMATGALERERDYLDVRDVCRAYAACIARDAMLPDHLILNLASGGTVKIGTLLAMLLARSKVKITIRTDSTRLRMTEMPRAAGNATRAAVLLDWQPQVDLEAMLDAVLDGARRSVG